MRLVKLEDIETTKPFDCGDSDLNGFFCDDACYYHEQMIANTFVLEDDTDTIAFFSLLNDKISQKSVPNSLWRKLRKNIPHRKHFSSYPAIKIGRLAISKKHQRKGLGTTLLSAIKQMSINPTSPLSASRFLTVDAYVAAVPFYEENGFVKLVNIAEGETVPMYYDLKQLK